MVEATEVRTYCLVVFVAFDASCGLWSVVLRVAGRAWKLAELLLLVRLVFGSLSGLRLHSATRWFCWKVVAVARMVVLVPS